MNDQSIKRVTMLVPHITRGGDCGDVVAWPAPDTLAEAIALIPEVCPNCGGVLDRTQTDELHSYGINWIALGVARSTATFDEARHTWRKLAASALRARREVERLGQEHAKAKRDSDALEKAAELACKAMVDAAMEDDCPKTPEQELSGLQSAINKILLGIQRSHAMTTTATKDDCK